MLVFYILAVYTAICAFLLFVLLMGQSPSFRDTCVGSMNRLIRNLPQNFLYCICLLRFGFNKQKAAKSAEETETYCVDKPNPFIQMFYALLVFPALYFFFNDIAPQMKNLYDVVIVLVISIISIIFYCLAWLTDPGTVLTEEDMKKKTTSTAMKEFNRTQNHRFAYDGLFYSEHNDEGNANFCKTCKVMKPARSKHSSVTGRCVRRFDHYCPWVVNDVGENNLKWFHAFLISHVIMSAFVAFWSGWVLYEYIQREKLWFAQYAKGKGITSSEKIEALRPSWYIVLLYAMSQNSVAAGLSLFAGMVSILLFGFWWMNFVHVLRNETTNEQHKREDIVDHIKRRTEWEEKQKEKLQEQEKSSETSSSEKLLNDLLVDEENDAKKKKGMNGGSGQQQQQQQQQSQQRPITMIDVMNSRKFYGSGSYFRNIVEAFWVYAPAASELARRPPLVMNTNSKNSSNDNTNQVVNKSTSNKKNAKRNKK